MRAARVLCLMFSESEAGLIFIRDFYQTESS